MSEFSSSRLRRGTRIAKSGLRVGTNYAMHHFKRRFSGEDKESEKKLHTANAQLLYNEFSNLRGTALKLAQMLSQNNGLFPEEFVEVMSQANYQVPPINKALVRQIIKKELDDYPESVFAGFNPEAFAAASIGQVHQAVLRDGREVSVKIQYPDVKNSIDSDLSMAKMVFKRMVKSEHTDLYFGEIYEKMMEETDYIHEGAQIADFHERYNGERFVIPEYIPEYSTSNVLTMTTLSGEHVPEFLARNPSQQERDQYGQLLWDFFHAQINDARTLHADAHPGNFLLCKDGRLGVLDFGCVKKCPSDFFTDYVSLLPFHMKGDEGALKDLYIRLGLIDEHSSSPEYEKEFFYLCKEFGDLVISPYNHKTFNFGDETFGKNYRHLVKAASAQPEPRGTHHFIYVTRAHVGLYHLLMQLGATVETQSGKEQVLGWWNRNKNR